MPPRVLTNADLEKMVDTTDEWILQRTGIRERHIVDPGVATSDLGKEAALKAISKAGLTPDDIGLIVVGTVTPDMMFPSTACLVQHKIGAHHAWGFDLERRLLGVHLLADDREPDGGERRARSRAGRRRRRDVEHHRLQGSGDLRAVRRRRRRVSSCRRRRAGDGAILDFEHEIDGSGGPALCMPAGGSLQPAVARDGRPAAALREAGRADACSSSRCARPRRSRGACSSATASTPADLDLFVSHQANRRIIQSATEKLGVDAGQGDHQHRAVRQHDRGDHSARAERRRVSRPAEEGRSRAAGVGRRRLHRRRRAAALGILQEHVGRLLASGAVSNCMTLARLPALSSGATYRGDAHSRRDAVFLCPSQLRGTASAGLRARDVPLA